MNATPDWQLVKTRLAEALDLPKDERTAYLDHLRGEDPALCDEVAGLLLADAEAGDFIETPAVSLRKKATGTDSVGRWIGPYVITAKLGQGGMGTVYLARRADDTYERQVAIKLLKRGMDTAEIVGRFHHERRILAQLDHPRIAKLLDAGSTDDGLPYFVMEHVEGEPIDEYCELHRLGIGARLELFCTVCEAVSFAHRHLVVHRDLKPANILVTALGQPTLLDFGIAKLLGPEGEAQTELTTLGARAMTPEYASPEQVLGLPITTASDFYTLGVLLYRLLTGHRPYRLTTRSGPALARVICEQQPERPSTAVRRAGELPSLPLDPARLHRRLRGDLDAIVLKTLRKEPLARYGSADELAADIRRHLDHQPVAARRGTLAYRTGRFLKRNWLPTAVAAAFLALAIGFGAREIQSAKRLAVSEARAAQAMQLEALLESIVANADVDRTQAQALTARAFLDAAAQQMNETLRDLPENRANLADALGRAYRKLGELDKARALLEDALGIREQLFGSQSAEVASSLQNLGALEQAKGNLERAEQLMRRALAIREHVHRGRDHEELAIALNNLAGVLLAAGTLDEAEALGQRAVDMNRRLFGADHLELTNSLNTLGNVLQKRQDYPKAEAVFRKVLEIRRAAEQARPNALATALLNLGLNLLTQNRPQEAEPLLREARAIWLELVGVQHSDTARIDQSLGSALMAQGRFAEAEPFLLESLEILQHPGASPEQSATARAYLAALYRRWGKLEKAALYAAEPNP